MGNLLIVVLIVAGFGTMLGFVAMFAETYGSRLENYINSRNPQNAADVERFTRDFETKEKRFI